MYQSYKATSSPEGQPRHMCTVVISGSCAVAGQPPHELQMHSADDFSALVAALIKHYLGRSVDQVVILDVDTVTGVAEKIDQEEAHRRFAPACLKSSPGGLPGSSKADSRDN